ncbi:MAG: ATP synthase F1 subunit delta [Sphingobacteriales bacterium]|uniref:ATP synthase F1 subunit delta n=1 Tax=Hydrotalea flava TaxID=714549 RepID=UPI000834DDE3|nr:ATP synthase F1 subunit delta [Hydrotalea flava]RTL50526.1 MAG: ATP synthase F1 subunit delta [Sphingobacteriales bacterium]
MNNPRLANRYAKSLIDISIERNELEKIMADMQYLQAVCKASREFVNLLESPVVTSDKKNAIIKAVTGKSISALTALYLELLVKKGRENVLPEIANAFIDHYNELKGIHIVTLTTAVPVSDSLKNAIETKVKTARGFDKIQLETKVDKSLIGGFVLSFQNNLVDASVLRDLKDIKKQFQQNLYVQQIR